MKTVWSKTHEKRMKGIINLDGHFKPALSHMTWTQLERNFEGTLRPWVILRAALECEPAKLPGPGRLVRSGDITV